MEAKTRTIDGKLIKKEVYDKISYSLCKGLLSSDEIKNYLKLEENYNQELQRYGLKHRGQLITLNKKESKQYIQRLLSIENKESINKYKKARNTITMNEHLAIIKDTNPGETIDKLKEDQEWTRKVWKQHYINIDVN